MMTGWSKIPDEYFVLNESAIRAGERDIPGVKIYQKTELRVG
jgi:hypothetical protein